MSEDCCPRHPRTHLSAQDEAGQQHCEHCLEPWTRSLIVPLAGPLDASYFTEVRRRAEALERGKADLRTALASLIQCCEDLMAAVSAAVQTLKLMEQQALTELAHVRASLEREIEAAVEEAGRAVFTGLPTRTRIATAMLQGQCPQDQCLQIFKYQIHDFSLKSCSKMLSFSIQLPPSPCWLVAVPSHTLAYFSPLDHVSLSTPLASPLSLTATSSFVFIGEGLVLACGGGHSPCMHYLGQGFFPDSLCDWGGGEHRVDEAGTL